MAPPEEPVADPSELYGLIPEDFRQQVDPRELIARIVDGSRFHEFKENGETLVCGFARLEGFPVGILANNGVLFAESSQKGAHFIEARVQAPGAARLPPEHHGVHGRRRVREGRHCARRRQARYGDRVLEVPKFTVATGGSFGAGNYAMCGRAYGPRQLWMWPNARISVMGGEQAATVLTMVGDADPGGSARSTSRGPNYSTARLWDDGIIDPLDTRRVLALGISAALNAPIPETEFGIFRLCSTSRSRRRRLRSGGLRGRGDPHYERAIEAGLDDEQLVKAMLGLGSSLRNVDRIDESVTVLENAVERFPATRRYVFLAFSLWSAGRGNEALSLLARRLGEGSDREPGDRRPRTTSAFNGLMAYTFVDVDILEGEGPGGMVEDAACHRSPGLWVQLLHASARHRGPRAPPRRLELGGGLLRRPRSRDDADQRADRAEAGTLRPCRSRLDPGSGRRRRRPRVRDLGAPLDGGYEPPDWG